MTEYCCDIHAAAGGARHTLGPPAASAESHVDGSHGPGWDRGEIGCLLTTDDDMEAFVSLPDCERCEGTGKQLPPGWRSQDHDADEDTSEPNPHPRHHVSTHEVLEDYDGAIRCSSDWPPEKRHAALDRTMGHIRPLVYEVEHLRVDLAAARADLDAALVTIRVLQDEVATARRDGAADALDWAAGIAKRIAGGEEVYRDLCVAAAEVRAGRRTIPPADRSQT